MAKLSEVLKDFHKKIGVIVDESEYTSLEGKEVPDGAFDKILDTDLENYGKNRAKSVHANYDAKIDGFKGILSDDKLSKVRQQQGEKKLDALKDAFKEALDDAKKAHKNDDPEALSKANNEIVKLEDKLIAFEEKYKDIDIEGLIKQAERFKKKSFDTDLKMKFKESELSEDFKKGSRINLKVSDFDSLVSSYGYLIDYETGKVTDKEGSIVTKKGKEVTVDNLVEEAIGEDRKIGQHLPIQGQINVSGTAFKRDRLAEQYAERNNKL